MVIQFSDDTLRKIEEATAASEVHAKKIGSLCLNWAYLDTAIDQMFQPLLGCSDEQVACILIENVSARCEMLKRLVCLEHFSDDWGAWVCKLLDRVSSELAPARNRCVHDVWAIKAGIAIRTDKRAKIVRAQAGSKPTVRYNIAHPATELEIECLDQRIFTVSTAMKVVLKSLFVWRSEQIVPTVDQRWLPAGEPNARFAKYRDNLVALERPVEMTFAFD